MLQLRWLWMCRGGLHTRHHYSYNSSKPLSARRPMPSRNKVTLLPFKRVRASPHWTLALPPSLTQSGGPTSTDTPGTLQLQELPVRLKSHYFLFSFLVGQALCATRKKETICWPRTFQFLGSSHAAAHEYPMAHSNCRGSATTLSQHPV
jgi:hypothetical protein